MKPVFSLSDETTSLDVFGTIQWGCNYFFWGGSILQWSLTVGTNRHHGLCLP
jgi:hypothetical protein